MWSNCKSFRIPFVGKSLEITSLHPKSEPYLRVSIAEIQSTTGSTYTGSILSIFWMGNFW